MAKTSAPVRTTRNEPNPVTIYEDLLRKGFSKDEAATQVARLWGLQVTHIGAPIHWTIEDVTKLLFLAHRVSKKGKGKG
jgi:hypothetical protein